MALVLEAVMSNGATRFSISRHTGTSYKLLKKYLQTLTEIGFIEMAIKENRVIYRTSKKGLDFLRQYYVLLGLLSASAKNRSTCIVYELKYNAPNIEQRSATQIVTHL
jgi:predicted transcriptional regulator